MTSSAFLASSLLASAILAAGEPAAAPPKPVEGVSLTVYSSADPAGFNPQQFIQQQRMNGMDNAWGVPGYGVVKDVRRVRVPTGAGDLAFTDVAAWIDPTTVSFSDLDDARTSVLEQNFQFDLVSPSKLLERYLGRTISAVVPMGESVSRITGELLSATQGQLVLKTADGLRTVPAASAQIELGELPGGLLTKPTLVWKLASPEGGDHLVRTTYQTAGMTWRADYNLVVDGDDASAAMTAWVTLMNLSGASYPDAELKLVAGDVQKIEPRPQRVFARGAPEVAMMADAAGFVEKEFADFHLYTLPRRTSVAQNSTQQIALFPPVSGFKVLRELVFDFTGGMGAPSQPIVDRDFVIARKAKPSIFVSFENRKDNALGMPLPKGKIRVYKEDPADGTLEFIGEDLIDHTPRNETVKVRLGEAFDVVGERIRSDFTIDGGAKRMTETFRIELRNQKSAPQKVRVIERLYRWSNWDVKSGRPFAKLDSGTIAFDVEIGSERSEAIEYVVTYTW